MQAAILVRNNTTGKATATAEAYLQRTDNTTVYVATCKASRVAAKSYAVCFGPTVKSNQYLWAGGFLNDVQVWNSPTA